MGLLRKIWESSIRIVQRIKYISSLYNNKNLKINSEEIVKGFNNWSFPYFTFMIASLSLILCSGQIFFTYLDKPLVDFVGIILLISFVVLYFSIIFCIANFKKWYEIVELHNTLAAVEIECLKIAKNNSPTKSLFNNLKHLRVKLMAYASREVGITPFDQYHTQKMRMHLDLFFYCITEVIFEDNKNKNKLEIGSKKVDYELIQDWIVGMARSLTKDRQAYETSYYNNSEFINYVNNTCNKFFAENYLWVYDEGNATIEQYYDELVDKQRIDRDWRSGILMNVTAGLILLLVEICLRVF